MTPRPHSLRPYQERLQALAIPRLEAGERFIASARCGAGKTTVAANIVQRMGRLKVLWLTHRNFLLSHAVTALATQSCGELDVTPYCCNGRFGDVILGMVPTLFRATSPFRRAELKHGEDWRRLLTDSKSRHHHMELERIDRDHVIWQQRGGRVGLLRADVERMLADVNLVVVDEAHHSAAPTWAALIELFLGVPWLGLSATPTRHDLTQITLHDDDVETNTSTRTLADCHWGETLLPREYGGSAEELIAAGYLVKPKWQNLDDRLQALGMPPADLGSRADALTVPSIVQIFKHSKAMSAQQWAPGAWRNWGSTADWPPTLVFACNLKESRRVVEAATEMGLRAMHIDGDTKNADREQAFQAFQAGELHVVTSVDVFAEGVDLPAAALGILLRKNGTLPLHHQVAGRYTRPPGPGAPTGKLVIDCAKSQEIHGCWTLEVDWPRDRNLASIETTNSTVAPRQLTDRVLDLGYEQLMLPGFEAPEPALVVPKPKTSPRRRKPPTSPSKSRHDLAAHFRAELERRYKK